MINATSNEIFDVFFQVPRVFIGGKCIGGGSEVMTLNSQDKLQPMLKEAGVTFKTKDT